MEAVVMQARQKGKAKISFVALGAKPTPVSFLGNFGLEHLAVTWFNMAPSAPTRGRSIAATFPEWTNTRPDVFDLQ